MNGVQTRFKCKLDVKRCKRFVFPPSSLLPRSNALKTKAIRYFQTDRTLTRIVSPPLLINMELAPLKRFTTQVYESMYKRSAFHNRQLEELLTVFISGLPDKPVTGLKQLLELYLELLTINRSKVTNEQLLQRLQEWATNSNLKKVTTSLNKL